MKNKEVGDSIFDLVDALRSPVLTHSEAWKDLIPERILHTIPIARMAYLVQKKEYATEEEAVVFIMTRAFESPMTSEWTDIYTHLSCKVLERHFKEDHWDDVMAPRELDDYSRNYLLNPILKHIYQKRRMILKNRLKTSLKEQPEAIIQDEYKQLDLF